MIIDSPPSLGLLTLNTLVAAREVLIPIQCEYYALEGVTQLMRTVELVQQNLNPELEVSHRPAHHERPSHPTLRRRR